MPCYIEHIGNDIDLVICKKDDDRKYIKKKEVTEWDRTIGTHLHLICPYDIGNIIHCIEMGNDCLECLEFYAYCKNYTCIGRLPGNHGIARYNYLQKFPEG